MINLPCGWDPILHCRFRRSGCGVWVGYETASRRWGYLWHLARPHFHNGIPYCENCYKGFGVVHLGQGLLVRPKEESDVPVGGPGLTELYP